MTHDVLDGSFRGKAAGTCAKKPMGLLPNFNREFQRDQLQQSQGDGREHGKPFITCPAALDLRYVFCAWLLQALIFPRFSRVSRQPFGPEVIAKRAEEMFEHGKQGLHPHWDAI